MWQLPSVLVTATLPLPQSFPRPRICNVPARYLVLRKSAHSLLKIAREDGDEAPEVLGGKSVADVWKKGL